MSLNWLRSLRRQPVRRPIRRRDWSAGAPFPEYDPVRAAFEAECS